MFRDTESEGQEVVVSEEATRSDSVRDELRRLEADHGSLTPRIVVDAAEDEESPLHRYFEWDDSVAGQRYREAQARRLIRVVVARDISADAVPAFVHITDEEGPRYVSTTRLLTDDDMFRIALGELSTKLRQAMRSVEQMMSLRGDGGGLAPVKKSIARAQKLLDRASA